MQSTCHSNRPHTFSICFMKTALQIVEASWFALLQTRFFHAILLRFSFSLSELEKQTKKRNFKTSFCDFDGTRGISGSNFSSSQVEATEGVGQTAICQEHGHYLMRKARVN